MINLFYFLFVIWVSRIIPVKGYGVLLPVVCLLIYALLEQFIEKCLLTTYLFVQIKQNL